MSYYATYGYDIGDPEDEEFEEVYQTTSHRSTVQEVLDDLADIMPILCQYHETFSCSFYKGYDCLGDLEFDELTESIKNKGLCNLA